MIEFCNVTFKYPYDEFSVLENTSFALSDGVNTLLCNYQSGKTTICKLILGLLVPQSGSVTVDGEIPDAKHLPDVLYLPQNPVFFENKTVLFNMNYPAKVRKISPTKDVSEIAERFGLGDKLNQKAKTLSQQERLNLAVARGLTVPRKHVLFDGFFDNSIAEESTFTEIFAEFKSTTILSENPQNATGQAVVLDGKQAVFCGDARQACEVAKTLWPNMPK